MANTRTQTAPLGVRRQEVPGQVAVFTWYGSSDWIRHEIRCEPGGAGGGSVYYQVWAGDMPSPPLRLLGVRGEDAARRHIDRVRRFQSDRMDANRWLARLHFDRTEHAERRTDCNCKMCAPAGLPDWKQHGRGSRRG